MAGFYGSAVAAIWRAFLARQRTRKLHWCKLLAVLEWSALVAENEGGLHGLRESREHRRLFQKNLDDFEKSVVKPLAKVRPPKL
jgi:hypothetical protein